MEIIDQTKEKMNKSIDSFKKDLASIRTGAANPSLLESISVEVYGSFMPLSNVATVSVQDATTLMVQVWDAGNVEAVDKSIRTSELSLNPRAEGSKLYIPLPQITTERRKELVKIIKQKSEEGKVSIRTVRRSANDSLKDMEKAGEISEDELNQYLKEIQKTTDFFSDKIDQILNQKEKDLMNI